MKKEYIEDLQRRLRECESAGVEASSKIQGPARKANEEKQKLIDENRHLRMLLDQQGRSLNDMSDGDVSPTTKLVDAKGCDLSEQYQARSTWHTTESFPVDDVKQAHQRKVWQGSQIGTLLRKVI